MRDRTEPIYVPPGGPGNVERPSPAILEALGEAGVFRMLADLYAKLELTEIRSWFPPDMQKASEKSAAFFVQLLGGRALFNERFGPPRMRQRHMPFEIDETAREIWLQAFAEVLENAVETYGFPEEHLSNFRSFLTGFSAWMVNVAPPSAS